MNNASVNPASISKISHHGFADLFRNLHSQHHSLHSTSNFVTGDVITPFQAAAFLKEPSRFTVQLANDMHIILSPEFLQYINHSCLPNTFFDTDRLLIVALTNIEPGDEYTFFYPSTEWDMAEAFDCHCGSAGCMHSIQGAKYLSPNNFKKFKFNQHIRDKYLQQH